MLLTSNGSCYVGECSVPTAIPEQAGDSKMDCPSTPSNSVKNINKKMFMSRKPSGPNSPLGSLSLSLPLPQARKCVRKKDPGNEVAIHPSPLSHKCEEMLPYPGTSMGRELLHVDYFSDARSKAVHCVCSTPAGVFEMCCDNDLIQMASLMVDAPRFSF